jgi:hypothetical protein
MNGTFGARAAVKTSSVSLAATIEASGREAELADMRLAIDGPIEGELSASTPPLKAAFQLYEHGRCIFRAESVRCR